MKSKRPESTVVLWLQTSRNELEVAFNLKHPKARAKPALHSVTSLRKIDDRPRIRDGEIAAKFSAVNFGKEKSASML